MNQHEYEQERGGGRIHVPGQPPPPDRANPISVSTDPQSGLTIVKHINGSEVVFAPDGTMGLRNVSGSFLQFGADGHIKIVGKKLTIVTDDPVYHVQKMSDGSQVHSHVDVSVLAVVDPNAPPTPTE